MTTKSQSHVRIFCVGYYTGLSLVQTDFQTWIRILSILNHFKKKIELVSTHQNVVHILSAAYEKPASLRSRCLEVTSTGRGTGRGRVCSFLGLILPKCPLGRLKATKTLLLRNNLSTKVKLNRLFYNRGRKT